MPLTTGQLMRRVRERHGELAEKIAEDFNRDSALAQGKVVALYLLAWGVPVALLYAAGWYYERRRALVRASTQDTKSATRARPKAR
jgi:hypothetical protein